MGIHDRDYMRRKPKGPVEEIRGHFSKGNRWQTWGAIVVIGLVITAAVWPRKSRPYYSSIDSYYSDTPHSFEAWPEPFVLDPVDINEASLEEILQVPEVDEEIAQGIIDKRPFAEIDDLLDVRGIGKSNLLIIRQHVYIDND